MLTKSRLTLPKGLEPVHRDKAIDYVERETSELVDLYYEQRNIFSCIVGMYGLKALDAFSPFKRHKHPDVAQQRFPDLSLRGRLNPPPQQALEQKGRADLGLSKLTTIIQVGTSSGAMQSTRPNPSRPTAKLSSGESTWFS